jgi:phospholipid/cholesterol/gamma-HCH transport system ATP-binding protein
MAKRVGLLRATMLDPKIILFDEPTSGLDPIHVGLFARTVQKFKAEQGMTAVFVTHDVECAFAIADRIAMLRDGVIHAIGPAEQMKQSKDPFVRAFLFPDFGRKPEARKVA